MVAGMSVRVAPGLRTSPESLALGKAAKNAKEALDRGEDQKMAAMRDRLQQGILAQVEDAGVNGDGAPRVPNTQTFTSTTSTAKRWSLHWI